MSASMTRAEQFRPVSDEIKDMRDDAASPAMDSLERLLQFQALSILSRDKAVRSAEEADVLMRAFGSLPFFASLPTERAMDLAKVMRLASFISGDVVFNVGDAAHEVYLIYEGDVAIMTSQKDIAKSSRRSLSRKTTPRIELTSVDDDSKVQRARTVSDKLALVTERVNAGLTRAPDSNTPLAASSSSPLSEETDSKEDLPSTVSSDAEAPAGLHRSQSQDSSTHSLYGLNGSGSGRGRREREVALLTKGDVFGERCVLESVPRYTKAVCRTSTTVLVFDKWPYHQYVRGVSDGILDTLREEYLKAGLPFGPPENTPVDEKEEEEVQTRELGGMVFPIGSSDKRYSINSNLSGGHSRHHSELGPADTPSKRSGHSRNDSVMSNLSVADESVSTAELYQLAERMQKPDSTLDIADRSLLGQTYRCFIAEDMVQWLLKNTFVADTAAAVRVGKQMQNCFVIKHVLGRGKFSNDYRYYQFIPKKEGNKLRRAAGRTVLMSFRSPQLSGLNLGFSNFFQKREAEKIRKRRSRREQAQELWDKRSAEEKRDGLMVLRDIDSAFLTPYYMEDNLSLLGRLEKASRLIDDAIQGRTIRPHRVIDPWERRLDVFFNGMTFSVFMFLIVLLNMGVAAFEPPAYRDGIAKRFKDNFAARISVEWLCLALYCVEVAWEIWDLSWFWYRKRTMRLARILVLGLIFVDVLGATIYYNIEPGTWIRFSRCLRPILLLWRSFYLRRMYSVFMQVIPKLVELLVIVGMAVTFFSVIGFQLFTANSNLYQQTAFEAGQEPYSECEGQQCGDLPEFIFKSFSGAYSEALVAMFVLLTRVNYPNVAYPAYVAGHVNISFFLAYLGIVVFFLMQILIAMTVHSYRMVYQQIGAMDEVKEKHALAAAFKIMDVYDAGVITYDTFRGMLMVRGGVSEYKMKAIFAILDQNQDGVIDMNEFNEVIEAFLLDISKKTGVTVRRQHTEDEDGGVDVEELIFQGRGLRAFLLLLIESILYRGIVSAVILIDIVCLLVIGGSSTTQTADDIYARIDLYLVAFFLLDICIGLYVFRWGFFRDEWRWFDVIVTTCTVLGCVVVFTDLLDSGVLAVLRLFGLIRSVKFLSVFPKFSIITSVIISSIPVFVGMAFALISVLFYVFSIAGMELFHGGDADQGAVRCSDIDYIANRASARFCDIFTAALTLFQILTGPSWHTVMYGALSDTTVWSAIYFVLFYFLTVVILLNLLLAVFLDMFILKTRDIEEGTGQNLSSFLTQISQGDESGAKRAVSGAYTKEHTHAAHIVVRHSRSLRRMQRKLRESNQPRGGVRSAEAVKRAKSNPVSSPPGSGTPALRVNSGPKRINFSPTSANKRHTGKF